MTDRARRDAETGQRMVESEAHRLLTELHLAPDPARVAAGWERRFVTDRTRAREAMELYERLGFDVVADPLRPDDLREECDDCQLVALLKFMTIYTRPRGGTAPDGARENDR